MSSSEEDLEVDERNEQEKANEALMNEHYEKYIGTGPAHIEAPNREFRHGTIEENVTTKHILNVDGSGSNSDSVDSISPAPSTSPQVPVSSTTNVVAEPEQKSADIFDYADSPPLQSYITPPEFPIVKPFHRATFDPNLEEEEEEDDDDYSDEEYYSEFEEIEEYEEEMIRQSVEKIRNESIKVEKKECIKEKIDEEEEDLNFMSMNVTSEYGENGESSQKSTTKPSIKRNSDQIAKSSSSVQTPPPHDEKQIKHEKEDSDEIVESSPEEELKKEHSYTKPDERLTEKERKERDMLEQLTVWERDQISRNEALLSVLKTAADAETCFDPDFFSSRSKLCRFDGEKVHFIYTPIIGVNDNEVFSNSGIHYYAHGTMRQPWFPVYNSRKECLYDRKILFERMSDVFLRQYQDGYLVFETFIHDVLDTPLSRRSPFYSLKKYYDKKETEEEREKVLETFAFIVKLAREAEQFLPKNIVRLEPGRFRTVTLSQKQCAIILANMLIGLTEKGENFTYIMKSDDKVAFEKVRFIMNYFETIQDEMPSGNVSFRRRSKLRKTKTDLMADRSPISSLIFLVSDELQIEKAAGCSQMDFANQFIGGGVLGRGCVQEEIRFLMCPEMIVSMLLCEPMKDNEAIFIVGAQTYSSYEGYGGTLKWKELQPDDAALNKNIDQYGRIRNELIAVDATEFGNRTGIRQADQFKEFSILREINKLIAGFEFSCDTKPPVVTGWWGCGAFNGNKQLKALLQVMAATITKRPLIFCTFGEERLAVSLQNIVRKLQEENITVGLLFRYCITYYHTVEMRYISIFDYVMSCVNRNKIKNNPTC